MRSHISKVQNARLVHLENGAVNAIKQYFLKLNGLSASRHFNSNFAGIIYTDIYILP